MIETHVKPNVWKNTIQRDLDVQKKTKFVNTICLLKKNRLSISQLHPDR